MTQPRSGSTLAPSGAAIVIVLTDLGDWQEPVRDAARLAAATGRRLRVVLADGGELLVAASLDCARLVASGGLVSPFAPGDARRLLKAQIARLRLGLQEVANRFRIEVELIEAATATETSLWAGSTALTVFARRRRGIIMVVHAGTAGTLEIAARLATERRQPVRLLSAQTSAKTGADPGALRRLFGPWLLDAPEPLGDPETLPRPAGAATIAALVIDPAWLEASRLTLEALRDQWLNLRTTEPTDKVHSGF